MAIYLLKFFPVILPIMCTILLSFLSIKNNLYPLVYILQ